MLSQTGRNKDSVSRSSCINFFLFYLPMHGTPVHMGLQDEGKYLCMRVYDCSNIFMCLLISIYLYMYMHTSLFLHWGLSNTVTDYLKRLWSLYGDIYNVTGHGPGKPALADPAWVGDLIDFQRSLQLKLFLDSLWYMLMDSFYESACWITQSWCPNFASQNSLLNASHLIAHTAHFWRLFISLFFSGLTLRKVFHWFPIGYLFSLYPIHYPSYQVCFP